MKVLVVDADVRRAPDLKLALAANGVEVTVAPSGSFALTIPGLGFNSIDPSFLAMAPNVVTIVAMALFATRVRQPAALARPFLRGLK